jgi:hypothetical protein
MGSAEAEELRRRIESKKRKRGEEEKRIGAVVAPTK